ncbi:MAG TPA: N-formylglutamate amidohydrolase [Flavobacteriaceae bacterium]|nr:N-formylglutamate amidohydrolase [Flavobacteriaceae bacterium]
MKLILTCEHAGNEIPPEFQYLFRGNESVLTTHRAFDMGAYDLFHSLQPLSDFSTFQKTSRLLVEMNRSVGNPNLFSEFASALASPERRHLLETYYFPYREKIQHSIKEFIQNGEKVFHLSVHSFTPVFNGENRTADMGLLYDPSKILENELSKTMKALLKKEFPNMKIRMNYPYLGTSDGLTTDLREIFPQNYIGIELEINQKFSVKNQLDSSIKIGVYKVVETVLSNFSE